MFSDLKYNKHTGKFKWKKMLGGRKKKVGSVDKDGYLMIKHKNVGYRAHRVAWYLTYGSFPKGQIDHINHDRLDNRIKNLRVVTQAENAKNCKKSKANSSGVCGVHWCKTRNRWMSSITVDRKRIHLGVFDSFSDAVDVRKNAEVLYGFHTNHGKG